MGNKKNIIVRKMSILKQQISRNLREWYLAVQKFVSKFSSLFKPSKKNDKTWLDRLAGTSKRDGHSFVLKTIDIVKLLEGFAKLSFMLAGTVTLGAAGVYIYKRPEKSRGLIEKVARNIKEQGVPAARKMGEGVGAVTVNTASGFVHGISNELKNKYAGTANNKINFVKNTAKEMKEAFTETPAQAKERQKALNEAVIARRNEIIKRTKSSNPNIARQARKELLAEEAKTAQIAREMLEKSYNIEQEKRRQEEIRKQKQIEKDLDRRAKAQKRKEWLKKQMDIPTFRRWGNNIKSAYIKAGTDGGNQGGMFRGHDRMPKKLIKIQDRKAMNSSFKKHKNFLKYCNV